MTCQDYSPPGVVASRSDSWKTELSKGWSSALWEMQFAAVAMRKLGESGWQCSRNAIAALPGLHSQSALGGLTHLGAAGETQ